MSYFRDWFGRDAEHGYTGYNPKKRYISWDDGYDNYSDFFFNRRGVAFDKHNIQDAAQLLYTMSKVVGIKHKEFGMHGNALSGAMIPTDMLGNPDISTDVFIGAALQNIGNYVHQSHTERDKMRRTKSGKMTLNRFVQNVINAERVNKLMSEETPGYLKFVEKYKKHKYATRTIPDAADKKQKFLELFDRIIRYPEGISEEELEQYAEPIAKIKDLMVASGGIPIDYDQSTKLSTKISNVIKKYFEEEPPKDDKNEDGEDGDEDSEDSEGSDSSSMSGDGEDGEGSASEHVTDAEFMKSLVDSIQEDKVDDGEKFKRFIEEFKDLEVSSSTTKIAAQMVKLRSVDPVEKMAYENILKKLDMTKARVISTLLKRKSRDYQFVLKSTKSGRLDTNKLAEAKQHVPTVYEQIGKVTTNKLNVVILVDESGSMAGFKIDQARKAAIFLNESLKDVTDVRLFIYGHSADEVKNGTTQLRAYKETVAQDPYLLMQIQARHENRDGVAIHSVAKRVKQFVQDNLVMIVISDGEPSASGYRHDYARTHTRRMVNEVEKMGFQILQVTVGGYRSTDMFKHVINMDDMSTFPVQFTNFLKKKINSMIKERVTI